MRRDACRDYDAIVVGAGHNGLVTAAYLARAGLRTLLLEARDRVGGTAASESFAGATVNICNCDHITFRTTPVIEELRSRRPRPALPRRRAGAAQHGVVRTGRPWPTYHDVERTLDSLAAAPIPTRSTATARYATAAMPAVRLVLDAASRAAVASAG